MPSGAPNLTSVSPVSPDSLKPVLAWRVHLARHEPGRLLGLLVLVFSAAGLVWLMFGHPLPALAAVVLLLGSVRDYLFPIAYRLTEEGVEADSFASRMALRWKETRRCLVEPSQLTLTPLALPSRLDAFRGVTLRFAPDGEPGDRASILTMVARFAPTVALPLSTTGEKTTAYAPAGEETVSHEEISPVVGEEAV